MPGITISEALENVRRRIMEEEAARPAATADPGSVATVGLTGDLREWGSVGETATVPAGVTHVEIPTTMINYVDAARPILADLTVGQMASMYRSSLSDNPVSFEIKPMRKSSSSDLTRDLESQVRELTKQNENLRGLLREVLDDYQQIAAEGVEPFSIEGDDTAEKMKRAVEGAYIPSSAITRPTLEMIACKLAESYGLAPQTILEMPMGRTARTWELFQSEASAIKHLLRSTMKDSREPKNAGGVLWAVVLRVDGRQVAVGSHEEAVRLQDAFLERAARSRPVIAPWSGGASAHALAVGSRSQSSADSLVETYAMHYSDSRRTMSAHF